MRTMGKMIFCSFSFIPVQSSEFEKEIMQVIEIIKSSGLDFLVGTFSTEVQGEYRSILGLTERIFEAMGNRCRFILDIRMSNICGCDQRGTAGKGDSSLISVPEF